jgi:hypothetical protein
MENGLAVECASVFASLQVFETFGKPASGSVRSPNWSGCESQQLLVDLCAAEHSSKDPDERELRNSPASVCFFTG